MSSEEIQDLKKIIEEQQKIIELLKERLTKVADDIDLDLFNKQSRYTLSLGPYFRTKEWKW